MTAQTHPSIHRQQIKRIEIEARIVRRLQRIDDDLLQKLDLITQEAAELSQPQTVRPDLFVETKTPAATPLPDPKPTGLSRRQMLLRLTVGGTALATAGYLVTRPTAEEDDATVEPSALRLLLDLYEMMDRVGLDRLLASALVALGFSLEALKVGASALRSAVDFVAGALDRFEAAVPDILAGIQAVEALLDNVQGSMDRLETMLNTILDEAAPFTQAVDRFVDRVLDYLPFGIGDRIREAVEIMGSLIGFLPSALGVFRNQLLSPMRTWFPSDNADDMRAVLFTPARAELLDPVRRYLDDVIDFAERWDDELARPVQEALAQREEVRSQIAAYKQRFDLT